MKEDWGKVLPAQPTTYSSNETTVLLLGYDDLKWTDKQTSLVCNFSSEEEQFCEYEGNAQQL